MSDALIRITEMSQLLLDATQKVAQLDLDLKAAKAAQLRLEREDLPELMRELCLSELRLDNGYAVEVTNEIDCAITEENRPAAHAWLVDHGFGGLIKTVVLVAFEREQHAEAVEAVGVIAEATGRPVELKEVVHPGTLKSFIKEQRAAGHAVPEDLFGIFPYSKAKMTPPKKKKG